MYDLVTGSFAGNVGHAMYGSGAAMIGVVFVLFALDLPSLQTNRARIFRLVPGYSGLALAICGFVMRYRGIS